MAGAMIDHARSGIDSLIKDGPLPAPLDKRAGRFRDRNHHIPVSLSVHLCTHWLEFM
jgi:hypothetical protein